VRHRALDRGQRDRETKYCAGGRAAARAVVTCALMPASPWRSCVEEFAMRPFVCIFVAMRERSPSEIQSRGPSRIGFASSAEPCSHRAIRQWCVGGDGARQLSAFPARRSLPPDIAQSHSRAFGRRTTRPVSSCRSSAQRRSIAGSRTNRRRRQDAAGPLGSANIGRRLGDED